MARIRLIILAILAVFVVGAVASASASAASKGEFVNKESKPLVKNVFTATSGTTVLSAQIKKSEKELTKVTCTKDLALGVITSTTGGEQTVHFTGCTSSGVSCKTPGAAAGEIIVLTALLVQKLSPTEDTIVNTILTSGTKTAGTLKFECSGLPVEVRGSFYSNGVVINGGLKTLWPLTATQSGGVQHVLKNEAGVEHFLETSVNGGTFEKSAEEGTETVHFLEEGQFV